MLNVPVGAIVVVVAFLIFIPFTLYILLLYSGNAPLISANLMDCFFASFLINDIIFPPRCSASWELYGIFSLQSISAQPMIPRPIFLVLLVILSISGIGYLLTSITLSKNRTAFLTVSDNLS